MIDSSATTHTLRTTIDNKRIEAVIAVSIRYIADLSR